MTTILFSIILLLSTIQQVVLASESTSLGKHAKTTLAKHAKHALPRTFSLQPILNEALVKAVESGNVVDVKGLLEHKAKPNVPDSRGNFSLLWHAWMRKKSTIAALLIAHGADRQTGLNQWLFSAVVSNEPEEVAALLKQKADPNFTANPGGNVLLRAAMCGYHTITGLLLKHGAQVDTKDAEGNTPLANIALQFFREMWYGLYRDSDQESKVCDDLKTTALALKKAGANMRVTFGAGNYPPGTKIDGTFSVSQLTDLLTKTHYAQYGSHQPCWLAYSRCCRYNRVKKLIEDFQKELLDTDEQKANMNKFEEKSS